MLKFIDLFVTFLQSIFVVSTIYTCVKENEEEYIKPIFSLITFIMLFSQAFYNVFGKFRDIGMIISHILSLMFIMIVYRKKKMKTITCYSIAYIIVIVSAIFSGNIIFAMINEIFNIKNVEFSMILFIYIPQIILILLCLLNIKFIKSIYRIIVYENLEKNTIVISFFLDFISLFYKLTLGENSQVLKNIVQIVFAIFIISLIFYFNQIHKKSQRILALNDALEEKNIELRKIKHDYGAQISYLYGLCLMKRYDDLKKSLKNIINNNNATGEAVEVSVGNDNEESLMSLALKPAVEKGIHTILEEECNLDSIGINQIELFRIVSNIVNNAVRAMNGQGLILVKTYEWLNNIVIKISNNGPKIPEKDLEKIFSVGFTTKENSDKSHGYGLSIVKEIVESNNGKITVHSTDEETTFKIIFKIK